MINRMGAVVYSVWIQASPEEVWRVYVDPGGTLLELRAQTHRPRGFGLLGKLVEAVILSPREAREELARLKRLIESNPKV